MAAFEPGGDTERKGWEEGSGGNREGDVAVRSTDHRRGDPSSFFTTGARRHYNSVHDQP